MKNTHVTVASSILGYTLGEVLYSSGKTNVYRAIQEDTQTSVVIKALSSEYPSVGELVQFRNQYAIARHLNHPGIVTPIALERYGNGYALIMPDHGYISLSTYWHHRDENLNGVFNIALQLADILHYLMGQRIIHKDIKPANLLIHPDTEQVQLTDFSIASLLPKERQALANPNILEGSLAYIAPEQTGRMNRGVDYRSDFYALGVTLYELLTGQLPFISDDPMALVHHHMTSQPPVAHSLNVDVPPILSEIILKLMAKNAEDRYQSALGLKGDLERCQNEWGENGSQIWFQLGEKDVSDRFLIPEKLYGREPEVMALLDAFNQASAGSTELMLVAGFSGIGKTAVVNEVHKPITRQQGYFIQGTFDQFNQNVPFSAVVQAFRRLMGQMLGESDRALDTWKTKILEAVGENGQVILDVIPELEHIIGSQPDIPELSASAAQNRFNLLFGQFIRVFTTKDHPLVIFLDDLQWADSASLNLIKALMADSASGYLLVVGAYRDNEVFPGHPLMLTLEEINKEGARTRTLTLSPLTQTDIEHLVADTMLSSAEQTFLLAQLVYQKTQGNPFFTTQFLKGLYAEGYITFAYPHLQNRGDAKQGGWQCNLSQVRQLSLTTDVVEFMVRRLQKLPKVTQSVLQLAACIGNRFDLATLAVICNKKQDGVAGDLWWALQEGLVMPESETYKFFQSQMQATPPIEGITASYRFLHDRVQQAAYALIPDEDKQSIHLQIGQRLFAQTSPEQQEERLFRIVGQLNMGRGLLSSQSDRNNLALLNLQAGCKAKLSTAYSAAVDYLAVARQLLAADCWTSNYQTTLDIFVEALEAEYLNTNFESIDNLADIILSKTQNVLDAIPVYEVKVRAWIGQGDQHKALEIGLNVLKLLNISLLNKKPDAVGDVAGLINATTMTDPYKLAAMRIMAYIVTPAWSVSPNDFQQVTFTMVDLSLRYGNCAESAFGYVWYGTLLCEALGNIDEGYEFGQLSVALLERFDAHELKAKVLVLYASCIGFWREHVNAFLPIHLDGLQRGLETGDLEFACYGAAKYAQYLFLVGLPLDQVRDESQQKLALIQHLKQRFHIDYLAPCLQGTLNLLGEGESLTTLSGPIYDEDGYLQTLVEQKQLTTVFVAYFIKSVLSYLFEEPVQAVKEGQIARDHRAGVAGTLFIPTELFYSSLARIACFRTLDEGCYPAERQNVEECLSKLKHWAQYAPMNYQHKCDLLEAELAKYDRHWLVAIEQYERAIAGAKEHHYIQEEAIANELAAKFYLDWGKDNIATGYMQAAYYCYTQWGAKAKVKNLERRYPQLLQPIFQQAAQAMNVMDTLSAIAPPRLSTPSPFTATSSSTNGLNIALDFATVLKATQAMSETIQLDQLLPTLTQIILQNSGCNYCLLALPNEEGMWQIRSVATPEQVDLCITDFSDTLNTPVQLIQYVKNTQGTVVINNGDTTLPIADEYLNRYHPKSVLCLPMMRQETVVGVLYLHNQLTSEVFSQDRILLLNFLCAQAAIALENARLYQQSQSYARKLEESHLHLVQSEKMSALGNLVAGVAHEINNPLGFVSGNISELRLSFNDITDCLQAYREALPNPDNDLTDLVEVTELDFVLDDLPKMLESMKAGCDRIRGISNSLRIFSRADTESKIKANIHDGIDSTILILKYRLKAKDFRPSIQVIYDYGDVPEISCFPGQLNQVFMNLLANAIDMFDEVAEVEEIATLKAKPQTITIQTQRLNDKKVEIRISDNGKGMSEEVCSKIFDRTFTTKAVGKGTGLGLAIAHQVITEKHGGQLEVISQISQGTDFLIRLPLSDG